MSHHGAGRAPRATEALGIFWQGVPQARGGLTPSSLPPALLGVQARQELNWSCYAGSSRLVVVSCFCTQGCCTYGHIKALVLVLAACGELYTVAGLV